MSIPIQDTTYGIGGDMVSVVSVLRKTPSLGTLASDVARQRGPLA